MRAGYRAYRQSAGAVALALVLAGCSGQPVKIPVPQACIDAEDVPDPVPNAADQLTKDSAPGEKIRAVVLERGRLRNADSEFRAIIRPCIDK